MPPLIYYKCSKCKMNCESYEAAEKCEQSHFSAASVKELEYRIGAYPYRVAILFPDGKEYEYVKVD